MNICPVSKMELLKIKKVAILEDGRLAVYPERTSGSYQYIYREAAGVYWNSDQNCFQSTVPRTWNYREWFSQIVCIVLSGLNARLILSDDTKYESLDDNIAKDIIASNETVQCWVDEQQTKNRNDKSNQKFILNKLIK